MKILFIAATILLMGCSTSQQDDFTSNVVTLTKAGCHLTVNISANVGATNPGSGFQAQGSADCPGALMSVPVTGGRLGAVEGEHAAPVASFLR